MRLHSKGCCRLHCWLRRGPRTQRMSLRRCCSRASRKCRLIWTVTRLFYSPFDPAVETTDSIVAACCHNHAEIKADVDAQVLSHAERGIRCLGIASSDAALFYYQFLLVIELAFYGLHKPTQALRVFTLFFLESVMVNSEQQISNPPSCA